MSIHYTNEHGEPLCHNAGFYSEKTTDPAKVTCRSCMRVMTAQAAQHARVVDWSNKNREGSSGYRTGDN